MTDHLINLSGAEPTADRTGTLADLAAFLESGDLSSL